MAEKIYNILDEKEMSEIISIAECRQLRQVMNMLTSAPMLTKEEYVRLMVQVNKILDRMEKNNDSALGLEETI